MTGLDAAAAWMALGYCMFFRAQQERSSRVHRAILIIVGVLAGIASVLNFIEGALA